MSNASPAGSPLASALARVTRPPILTLFGALQVLAICAFGIAHLAAPPDLAAPDPGTGDYLAFHVGGTIVREGHGERLYDFDVQRQVQDSLLGGPRRWRQRYLNPPALAMALAPATALGYTAGFRLFTLAMVLAFAGTLILGGNALPRLTGRPLTGLTAALLAAGYLPVALTMFGGQNTVLTLFLLMGVFWGLRRRRSVAAGVFVGLLLYKPQFALLPALLLVARRDWKAVASAAAVAAAQYVAGALVSGPAWPLHLLGAIRVQAGLEIASGLDFSIAAVAQNGIGGWPGSAVALLTAVAAVALVWWGARRTDPEDPHFPAFFAVVVLANMAISPHLQYYEAGLLALPVALSLETRLASAVPGTGERLVLAAGYFAFPVWRLAPAAGFQPLVLLLAGLLAWSLFLFLRGRSSPQPA